MSTEMVGSPELEGAMQKPLELASRLYAPDQSLPVSDVGKYKENAQQAQLCFEEITKKQASEPARLEFLKKFGFDPKELEGKGKELRASFDPVGMLDNAEMKRRYALLFTPTAMGQISHSDLSVGLKAEMTRQGRKLIRAIVDNNPNAIFETDDPAVNVDDIKKFVQTRNEDPEKSREVAEQGMVNIHGENKGEIKNFNMYYPEHYFSKQQNYKVCLPI